jgi:repressor LexA
MFSKRLKLLRTEKGLTQKDLAKILNVRNTTISKYELKEREPDIKTLRALSDFFGVSIDYLIGKTNKRNEDLKDIIELNDTISIPILGVIKAGEPIFAAENIEGYEYVDVSEAQNGEFFYLRVNGDSMIGARIYDGDLVYVRKQSDVDNGEIAVVLVNGDEATLKRVLKTNDSVILQPENPKYKPMVFKSSDVESGYVQIIGKVIHVKFKV